MKKIKRFATSNGDAVVANVLVIGIIVFAIALCNL
jgi:hypothetical protein